MNREIKFRGKCYEHRSIGGDDWAYGDFYHTISGRACVNQWIVKEKTVGQFTGLLDRLGVEIYEGDIVKRQKIARGRRNGTVKWVIEWQLDATHNGWNIWEHTKDQVEVIGNIVDNKDFLDVGN